jgi:hypothetical protein
MDYVIHVLKVKRNDLQGNILTFQQLEASYRKKGDNILAKAYQDKIAEANDNIAAIEVAIDTLIEME